MGKNAFPTHLFTILGLSFIQIWARNAAHLLLNMVSPIKDGFAG